jgi:hypothetical protein
MSEKRQKNQLVLAFTEKGRSEAPKASQDGTESRTAKCETERPASHEQLMEEVAFASSPSPLRWLCVTPLNRRMRTRLYGGVGGASR